MKNILTIGSVGAKIAIVLTATVGGVALVGSSVFASLTATATNNTTAQSVSTGTLKLTQAPSGVTGITAGFVTPISLMAPGDIQNRYIELSQAGTLDGSAMTLSVAGSGSNALTTDGTKGLQVTVNQCSVTWSNAGVCTGTNTPVLTQISALNLAGATPLSLAAGSYAASPTPLHLQIVLTLPTGSEVVTNGALPTGTVQNLTTGLTWTFSEAPRVAPTPNA